MGRFSHLLQRSGSRFSDITIPSFSSAGRGDERVAFSNAKAKSSQHFSFSNTRDVQGSAVQVRYDPFPFQRDAQERRSQRPANVRSSLAPIHARVRESPSQRSSSLDINAKRGKTFCPAGVRR
jgi:hypothetical protein